jgi:uncharacterized membrane protein
VPFTSAVATLIDVFVLDRDAPVREDRLLTMIVSLEAIFLSTFVMISQNRADAKREVLATQQWQTVQHEETENRELLRLSKQILDLTKAVHEATASTRTGP